MNKNYPCELIRDLLPGYIDEILSRESTDIVRGHLETCEKCRQIYTEMQESLGAEDSPKEQLALDALKKVRQRTKRIKLIATIAVALLLSGILSGFILLFVVGKPVPTHALSTDEISYDEDSGCLTISGTVNWASCRVSRVTWEQSEEDSSAVNVVVYAAETLPFQHDKNDFTISIPDMKAKKAYLACPEYDQFEIYNWKFGHYEELSELENDIYNCFPELDRTKDALSYCGGLTSVGGKEGIQYSVNSVIGENATFWWFNDKLCTDGDFDSKNYEIWISLEKPREIYLYDYLTGEYTQDHSILNRE